MVDWPHDKKPRRRNGPKSVSVDTTPITGPETSAKGGNALGWPHVHLATINVISSACS